MVDTIRVVLAEDQVLMRQGVRQFPQSLRLRVVPLATLKWSRFRSSRFEGDAQNVPGTILAPQIIPLGELWVSFPEDFFPNLLAVLQELFQGDASLLEGLTDPGKQSLDIPVSTRIQDYSALLLGKDQCRSPFQPVFLSDRSGGRHPTSVSHEEHLLIHG